MSDTKTTLRQYIVDNFILGSAGASFSDTDSFMESGILDSTGFLELVTYLEETYGFRIGDDEMVPENLDSLVALDAFIARKRAAA